MSNCDRYKEILEEIESLLEIDLLDTLFGKCDPRYAPMDTRLRELLGTLYQHPLNELTVYIRYTFQFKDGLPTWQPLLNATIERARMTHGFNMDEFVGLMPLQSHPITNVKR